MVSCHITVEEISPIILNKKDCDASVGRHDGHTERQWEKNEATPTDTNITATRNHNYFSYLTKFTAVTIAAAYVVSSASAFTQPQNRMVATSTRTFSEWQPLSLLGERLPSVTTVCTETTLQFSSLSSSTRLFMSAETESSSKSDQQEWRAVFLALQLYKAAYGDLKVPARFVVPSAAPWPGMYKQYMARGLSSFSHSLNKYQTTSLLILNFDLLFVSI